MNYLELIFRKFKNLYLNVLKIQQSTKSITLNYITLPVDIVDVFLLGCIFSFDRYRVVDDKNKSASDKHILTPAPFDDVCQNICVKKNFLHISINCIFSLVHWVQTSAHTLLLLLGVSSIFSRLSCVVMIKIIQPIICNLSFFPTRFVMPPHQLSSMLET